MAARGASSRSSCSSRRRASRARWSTSTRDALLLHRIAFNMAPSITRTPPTRSRRRSYTNMRPVLRDSVSRFTLLNFFRSPGEAIFYVIIRFMAWSGREDDRRWPIADAVLGASKVRNVLEPVRALPLCEHPESAHGRRGRPGWGGELFRESPLHRAAGLEGRDFIEIRRCRGRDRMTPSTPCIALGVRGMRFRSSARVGELAKGAAASLARISSQRAEVGR